MTGLRRRSGPVRRAAAAALPLLAAALLASCVTDVTYDCRYGLTAANVRYEVTSTAGNADIEVFGADGDLGAYRYEPTPWSRTERVRGDAYVRLRARSSQPFGAVSAAIYVDGVRWKHETGVGAVDVEMYGVVETEPGWDCGYGMFVQTWE